METLEKIKQRYDDDLFELISCMIVPSHSERPYPSHLKKQYQSFLQSKYNFLGGPYGKGPQENLQRKFCADIYQKILIQIERKKKTPD